jgi:chromosomal replication initiator protein
LKQTLSPDLFSQWIEPLKVDTLAGGDLILEAPSRFHCDWIEEHYFSQIRSCCHKVDSSLRVLLKPARGRGKRSGIARPYTGNAPLTTHFQAAQTFENYVVAPFNRFAFAAAQEVCQDGAPKFNPLFIEGPAGIGKTHLLQAIGNAQLANSNGRPAYFTCRDFPVYNTSVLTASLETILAALGGVKTLLVDDIHLVPKAGGFPQHLQDIFNFCYDSDIQMVFTANSLPQQIPDMPTSLRSRLGWGLIARIGQPDFSGFCQVIESILKDTRMEANADVCRYLAEQGPPNFREIRDRVEKLQEIVKKECHLSNLSETTPTIHENPTPRVEIISIQAIQKEVCAAYSLSPTALPGATKSRPQVIARQVAMYLSRKLTAATYAAIGSAFGGRDHSTVIYACRKVRAEMRRNRRFAERIVEIEKKLSRDYRKE